MTPQEQRLITELLDRLTQTSAPAKDADADQLIRKGVMENPDAPYLLVQTVLIQDMVLSQAQHRVAELEDQLAKAKAASSTQRSHGATSFLGRAFSRGSAPPAATAPGSNQSAASPASFGGAAAPSMMPSASSGFLRAAAATALGVAGGQLLFQGVESMFGQHAGGILSGQSIPPTLNETVVNNYHDDQGDPAAQDKSDDSTVADADRDQDGSDQDFDAADTASDDSFDGDDADLT